MTIRNFAWMALASGLLVLPATAAIAAKVVVVRSVGPSAKAYPPGKAMPDTTSIKLGNGDAVTLLGPNASRTLRGPGTFIASTVDRSSLAMAAGRRSRFGAMRSGEITSAPSLWDVDVTQSGRMCVAEPAKLRLWRPNADSAATLSIRGGPSTQAIEFPAGHATVPWPTTLPVANGGEFELELAGSGDVGKLNFVMVNAPPADMVGAAQLLIDKGCQNQLDLLVETAGNSD
jgi:hypothetical protein